MFATLATRGTRGARQQKGIDRSLRTRRYGILPVISRNKRLVVPIAYPVFTGLIDMANEREAIIVTFVVGAEDGDRAEVIIRRGKRDYERCREQVSAIVLGLTFIVHEDVGKRRGGVGNIGRPLDCIQELADFTVDALGVVVLVECTIREQRLVSGIDRSLVRLVVDDQQRRSASIHLEAA